MKEKRKEVTKEMMKRGKIKNKKRLVEQKFKGIILIYSNSERIQKARIENKMSKAQIKAKISIKLKIDR